MVSTLLILGSLTWWRIWDCRLKILGETISYLHWCINASKGTPQWGSLMSLSWPLTPMTAIQELLLVWFYKSASPLQNFLGTGLDIKGLHYGIACHPISKMSRMLIISSASIRSSSWNDHMSGISNTCICMFQKPVVVPICSGFYRVVLRALRWFMRFIKHLVLKHTCWERVRHPSVLVTHHRFCLRYFTPCWGLDFTSCNRSISWNSALILYKWICYLVWIYFNE